MKKEINTPNAPKAIGTYSQAVATENLLFISGQIPLDPVSMNLVDGCLLYTSPSPRDS